MATKPDIIEAIEALAIHCRPAIMDVEQWSLWLRDWCADLTEFPIEAIAAACRKWRRSGSVKFPTPGQLLPLVREGIPAERTERLDSWRLLTDDEYGALSVREKIRHHQILAHQAYLKAGPMFRNTSQGPRMSGVHLTPEEMDANHLKWADVGKHHTEEAHRLRQHLKGRPVAVVAE